MCADLTAGPATLGLCAVCEAGSTVTLLKLASKPPEPTFGPGNFQLIELGGSGATVVRTNMAGGAASRRASAWRRSIPSRATWSARWPRASTRASGSTRAAGREAADYPPDSVVTTSPTSLLESPRWYDDHDSAAASVITSINQVDYSYENYWPTTPPDDPVLRGRGRPRRRVVASRSSTARSVTGPAARCRSVGFGCFFLLQPVRAQRTTTAGLRAVPRRVRRRRQPGPARVGIRHLQDRAAQRPGQPGLMTRSTMSLDRDPRPAPVARTRGRRVRRSSRRCCCSSLFAAVELGRAFVHYDTLSYAVRTQPAS